MKEYDSSKPSEDESYSGADTDDEQLLNEIVAELEKAENNEPLNPSEENEENPEWDGSEAEFVEDDSSAEYEIPETGIKLSYVLTQDEMYKCLYHGNNFKTKGVRAVVQSIILGFASVIFFITYFLTNDNFSAYNLFFGIVCLVMILIIWIVPHLHLKSMSKMMADGKTIEVEIYPTHLDIGRNDGAWSIELDGSAEIAEFDNILMIYTQKGQGFAIPERVIEPEVYNEIKAILLSGTNPQEDE